MLHIYLQIKTEGDLKTLGYQKLGQLGRFKQTFKESQTLFECLSDFRKELQTLGQTLGQTRQ